MEPLRAWMFLMIVWAVIIFPALSVAAEPLVLATRDHVITNRLAESVLLEAYDRAGIDMKFVPYPGARSVIEADAGRADGEVARLAFVLKEYKNLIMVPVPIFHSELAAFVHSKYPTQIENWEALRGFSLTAVKGFKLVEAKLSGHPLKLVKSSEDAVELVENDRVEVAVLNSIAAEIAIGRKNAGHIMKLEPPLERLPVYHLLNKKHAALVPKLTAALKAMKKEGILALKQKQFVVQAIEN